VSKDDVRLESWEILEETERQDHKIFQLYKRKAAHPQLPHPHDFVIVACPDWVNLIALTPAQEVVLVRQYRHGTAKVSLEIPGGMVDPGEEPFTTAVREMREETGYTCKQWYLLGVVEPNPAFQTNRCWTYLGLDATLTHPQALDGSEMIDVEVAPLSSLSLRIASGEITHSLVIAAFFHYLERFGGWHTPSPDALAGLLSLL
jgi:8-oxo-dGTP pyrophosphatase MutT (NUDIX family)